MLSMACSPSNAMTLVAKTLTDVVEVNSELWS